MLNDADSPNLALIYTGFLNVSSTKELDGGGAKLDLTDRLTTIAQTHNGKRLLAILEAI